MFKYLKLSNIMDTLNLLLLYVAAGLSYAINRLVLSDSAVTCFADNFIRE